MNSHDAVRKAEREVTLSGTDIRILEETCSGCGQLVMVHLLDVAIPWARVEKLLKENGMRTVPVSTFTVVPPPSAFFAEGPEARLARENGLRDLLEVMTADELEKLNKLPPDELKKALDRNLAPGEGVTVTHDNVDELFGKARNALQRRRTVLSEYAAGLMGFSPEQIAYAKKRDGHIVGPYWLEKYPALPAPRT